MPGKEKDTVPTGIPLRTSVEENERQVPLTTALKMNHSSSYPTHDVGTM